jgi:hypothetical protein
MYKILAEIFESRSFSNWCYTENNTIFFVIDREGQYSQIVFEESDKTFKVENKKAITVYFVPIDNALITAQDSFHTFTEDGQFSDTSPRCDFILFSDETLCLVEFKMNMTSENERSQSNKAEDAIKQIWNTLDFILLESKKIGQTIPVGAVVPIISMPKIPNTTRASASNQHFVKWRDKFQEKFSIEIMLQTHLNF